MRFWAGGGALLALSRPSKPHRPGFVLALEIRWNRRLEEGTFRM